MSPDRKSVKMIVISIAVLEFLARLIFLIILINGMPSSEPTKEFLEEYSVKKEAIHFIRSLCILFACMISLEMILPPLLLLFGAITGNRKLLSMWYGHKILECIQVFMVLMFYFVKLNVGPRWFIRIFFGLYNLITSVYLRFVYIHIEEVQEIKEEQKKRRLEHEMSRPSQLPYPIQTIGY